MRPSAWLFVLQFGLSALLAQAQSMPPNAHSKALINVPQTRLDPCIRRLSSTNKLSAYSVIIPAHGTTLVTPHQNDYLVIALSPIKLAATGASGNSYQVELDEDGVQVIKGGWSHRLTNLSDTTAKLVEIDVLNGIAPERALCGLGASSCSDGRFGKTTEGTYTTSTLFETPRVKLTRVELGPGGVLERHNHSGSAVLVALAAIHLSDETGGNIERAAGETQAYPTHTSHQIQNIGLEEARFFELEVK
jgi:quercetin dioxygenase-like cupin family protein